MNDEPIREAVGRTTFDTGFVLESEIENESGGFLDEPVTSELYVVTRRGKSGAVNSAGERKLGKSRVDAFVKLEVADSKYEDVLD